MSDKIEASAGYYDLLAHKNQASGRGPNQARIYAELAALVRECSSLEEIQRRMKAEGFYESPGQALVLDKLLAHRDAAVHHGFVGLAELYQARHDAVAADPAAAWTTGWERSVADELGRIGQVVDAFNDLMSAYFEYRCAPFMTRQEPVQKMRDAVAKMQAHGESFEAVVGDATYRAHSAYSDEKYEQALTTIREVLVALPDSSAEERDYETRVAALLEGDQAALNTLREAYEARMRRSINLCVAPDTAPGEYTYEPFFEGKY